MNTEELDNLKDRICTFKELKENTKFRNNDMHINVSRDITAAMTSY